LEKLPKEIEIKSVEVYKYLASANRALAELKGYSTKIPNVHILINAMTLNESKDSSEIEQIVTTHDELYQELKKPNTYGAAKEVLNYRRAIWEGYQFIESNHFIHTNLLVELQEIIEPGKGGVRKIPGTAIQNAITGEVVHMPPQGEQEIRELLTDLENFINYPTDLDPLIKLAFIHYQFEAIHPFYDGNGRTGRVLNVLYLVLTELMDSPILYLSKYILKNKAEYYRLLKVMQDSCDNCDEWIIYILKGIEETSKDTLKFLKEMVELIEEYIAEIKTTLPKIYSKELVEALFFEFYTKSSLLSEYLEINPKTARNYLSELAIAGFLVEEEVGRNKIYKNQRLFDLIEANNR
jgi:Fic family protein